MTTTIDLPEEEARLRSSMLDRLDEIAKFLDRWPPELRCRTSRLRALLVSHASDYAELMTGSYNIATDDCVALTRERDILMSLVLRMACDIASKEIAPMHLYVSEINHMLREGMFFTEKYRYQG